MWPEHDLNRPMLLRAARSLGPLLERSVFVGGSVIGLVIDGPARRATKDVDLVAPARTVVDYEHDVAHALRNHGWSADSSEGAPLCRWVHPDAGIADVMSPDPAVFGFTNRWFDGALRTAIWVELEPGLRIRLAALPYFLATKVEAFTSRGRGDWMASHDLEDLLTVAAKRVDCVAAVDAADDDVRDFLIETFCAWTEPGSRLPARLPVRLQSPGPLVVHAQYHFDGDAAGIALADLALRRLHDIGNLPRKAPAP